MTMSVNELHKALVTAGYVGHEPVMVGVKNEKGVFIFHDIKHIVPSDDGTPDTPAIIICKEQEDDTFFKG